MSVLELDLDVHARRQAEAHQGVHRLRVRIEDVDESLMGADLELLARVLVDEGPADDAELLDLGGQGNRTRDAGAHALRRFDDLVCRAVERPVVEGLEPDPDPLPCHYLMISPTTPAPTVRPPSRIAKRRPCSI